MNNFKSNGPGGSRGRSEYIGGRPKSDANYGPKKKSGGKPGFGGKGGFKGGDRGGRGGDRGGFKGSRDGERREVTMHKATCASCGKPCEVPFRPDGSKPVLCSECFGKNRSDDRNSVERRSYGNDRPKSPQSDENYALLVKQIAVLEEKLNEVISLILASKVVADEIAEEVAEKTTPKKTATKKAVVKKAPAKKVAKKVAKKK